MNETEKDKKKDEFIKVKIRKLTAALYLVTNYLSERDPLKWNLRDRALKILSQTNEAIIFDAAINSIGQLMALFDVALASPGVSQMNFSLLKKEYEEVRNQMAGFPIMEASTNLVPIPRPRIANPAIASGSGNTPSRSVNNNTRREAILKFLRDHGPSSIKEIAQIMPEVSAKTVQRELADLVQSGALKREGDRRWSRYLII